MRSRPSLLGDGNSEGPALPLPDLSRSRSGSKLSPLLGEEADLHPRGWLPQFLGGELRNAPPTPGLTHSRHLEYL